MNSDFLDVLLQCPSHCSLSLVSTLLPVPGVAMIDIFVFNWDDWKTIPRAVILWKVDLNAKVNFMLIDFTFRFNVS